MKNYGWGSANLRREITSVKISQNEGMIEFANGSWIQVVTASDSGRGKRANILIVDEFRMVSLNVINTVLKRFITAPRQPGYLSNPEYKDMQERNKEIYMSSAWLLKFCLSQRWAPRRETLSSPSFVLFMRGQINEKAFL